MKPRSTFRNDFFDALAALKLAVAKIEACGELSIPEQAAVYHEVTKLGFNDDLAESHLR